MVPRTMTGPGRPSDIATELLEFQTLIGAPAQRRMEAKAVRVDTQLWSGGPGRARQALQAQVGRTGSGHGGYMWSCALSPCGSVAVRWRWRARLDRSRETSFAGHRREAPRRVPRSTVSF